MTVSKIDPAVRLAMNKINKRSGPRTVLLGSEMEPPAHRTLTTGSLSFDAALGGGWATCHWHEIIGHPSHGKTYTTLKMIAENQALDPKWTTVWVAAEDFVEEYAYMLGVDIDRIIVVEENIMEYAFQDIIDLLDSRGVDCIVIDSYPALSCVREDEGTMEDSQPGRGAYLVGQFLRKTNKYMKHLMAADDERTVTGFFINQWREKIGGYGDPRVTPGGKGKDFHFFQRADIRRGDWLTNTKKHRVGQEIRLINIKNKYAPPGREGVVDAYFSDFREHLAGEYDSVKDMVSAAITYGVIVKDGASHDFGEYHWHGRPKLDAAIGEDEYLQDDIRAAVLESISNPLPPPIQLPVKRSPKKAVAKKRVAR